MLSSTMNQLTIPRLRIFHGCVVYADEFLQSWRSTTLALSFSTLAALEVVSVFIKWELVRDGS